MPTTTTGGASNAKALEGESGYVVPDVPTTEPVTGSGGTDAATDDASANATPPEVKRDADVTEVKADEKAAAPVRRKPGR